MINRPEELRADFNFEMQQVYVLGLDHPFYCSSLNTLKGDDMSKENESQVKSILRGLKNTLLKSEDVFNKFNKQAKVKYDICIAIDSETLEEVKELRKKVYWGKGVYPNMELDIDELDNFAITLFTRNAAGIVNSTARLVIDGGSIGFPQEEFLSEYRQTNTQLIELGRLIIDVDNIELLKAYYRAFYRMAINLQCTAIVMSIKRKDVRLHKRLVDLKILAEDTENYGGKNKLDTAIWIISKTKDKFFKWANGGKK